MDSGTRILCYTRRSYSVLDEHIFRSVFMYECLTWKAETKLAIYYYYSLCLAHIPLKALPRKLFLLVCNYCLPFSSSCMYIGTQERLWSLLAAPFQLIPLTLAPDITCHSGLGIPWDFPSLPLLRILAQMEPWFSSTFLNLTPFTF